MDKISQSNQLKANLDKNSYLEN